MRMPYYVPGMGGCMRAWLCSIGFHEWTKWTDPSPTYKWSDVWIHQTRKCVHCNLSEESEI